VEQLNWIGTAPMFVVAALMNDNTVTVTLSQHVKATDFKPGVTLALNGRPATISSVLVRPDLPDVVHCVINRRVQSGDDLTWSYDGRHGFIQNLNGGYLLSVTAKPVRSR